MKIGPVNSGDRPHGPGEEGRRRPQVQPDRQQKADAVEISDSARSMSQQAASGDINDTTFADQIEASYDTFETDIRADKVEQARRRMESGFYDRPNVREEIARRIVDDFKG